VDQHLFNVAREQPHTCLRLFIMEALQNVNNTVVTKSNLSAWTGTEILTDQTENEAIRLGENKMLPDHLDLTERLYNVFRYPVTPGITARDYIALGPGEPTTTGIIDLYSVFRNSPPLKAALSLYSGLSYDSIDVVASLSDVKGVVGGVVLGYYPHKRWHGPSQANELAAHTLNDMTKQALVNTSPEAQLVSFSAAQDVKFNIPWQHPTPYIPRECINTLWDTVAPYPGTPVPWFHLLDSRYVSSVALPAQLRLFVKFNGLRFFAPNVLSESVLFDMQSGDDPVPADFEYDMQSGLEVAAAAAAAYVVESVVESGAEIVSDAMGLSSHDNMEETYKAGTYEAPTAVQMAYAGDTTSVGPPGTSPILFKPLTSKSSHEILTFLKRPQYLGKFLAGDSRSLFANPIFPLGWKTGPDQLCNYFRWFAQGAMYWRGTLNFHFVILGHPMVEVFHNLSLTFPPDYGAASQDVSTSPVLRGITNGTQHIVVPMPSFNISDHLPVIDNIYNDVTQGVRRYSGSRVIADFKVVSTMLDAAPEIPVLMFMSAGDDFVFLQPNPVGLGYVDNLPPAPFALDEEVQYDQQVGLCPYDVLFETRAAVQENTSTLATMVYVEDFFKIWSRAMPYEAYASNDEPIVAITPGTSPCWWPATGGAAASTLNVNNSWWVTNDYLSMFTAQFLYFRGSIGFKVIIKPGDVPEYKYIALANPANRLRQLGHNPYTFSEAQMPPEANFGYGTVVTPDSLQPVLDATIPYRSMLTWNMVNAVDVDTTSMNVVIRSDVVRNQIRCNIVLQEEDSDLLSALYRKGGSDYAVAVETMLPPPTLWLAKGYHWSA